MSLLSIEQLSREAVDALFHHTRRMEAGRFAHGSMQGKILIPLFFEPSTRTRLSFETAMLRLGGQVLSVPERGGLAIAKGESLPDTIRVVSAFGNLLVIRHPTETALALADQYAAIPVINAGNGCDEHPTQALLDLYTIAKEQGAIDGLNVGLVGDLKHARTMHSLAKGLTHYQVRLFLIAPEELRLPAACQQVVRSRQIPYIETPDLTEVIPELDVIYIVMLQHHRIADPQVVERLQRTYYCLTPELLARAKPTVTILHPLVRRGEVAPEVDRLPNAAYFRQAQNGVFVRMALLEQMLGAGNLF